MTYDIYDIITFGSKGELEQNFLLEVSLKSVFLFQHQFIKPVIKPLKVSFHVHLNIVHSNQYCSRQSYLSNDVSVT